MTYNVYVCIYIYIHVYILCIYIYIPVYIYNIWICNNIGVYIYIHIIYIYTYYIYIYILAMCLQFMMVRNPCFYPRSWCWNLHFRGKLQVVPSHVAAVLSASVCAELGRKSALWDLPGPLSLPGCSAKFRLSCLTLGSRIIGDHHPNAPWCWNI